MSERPSQSSPDGPEPTVVFDQYWTCPSGMTFVPAYVSGNVGIFARKTYNGPKLREVNRIMYAVVGSPPASICCETPILARTSGLLNAPATEYFMPKKFSHCESMRA